MDSPGLMGHAPAKVDDKGRIKIPSSFRSVIEERYGSDYFITSFEGDNALVFPMPVWNEMQARLARVPSSSMAKRKLLERAQYYGQVGSMDSQGRVLIPAILRTVAGISEDVVVLGNNDHLVIWDEQRIQKRLSKDPLTSDDWKELELHGV